MSHPVAMLSPSGSWELAMVVLWVDVVVAHVLLHGRADWQSSWVHGEHSAPGLFTTRAAARAAAEAQRVDGSVFYIREVPALCIRTENEVHLIADYLQTQAFSGLSVARLAPSLKTGTPLGQIMAALSPSTGCWVRRPPRNALLRLQLPTDAELTPTHNRRLTNWWSMVGHFEHLAWTAEVNVVDRTRVNAVRAAFQRVNAAVLVPEDQTRVLPSNRSEAAPSRAVRWRQQRPASPVAGVPELHWEDHLINSVARAVRSVQQYFGFGI